MNYRSLEEYKAILRPLMGEKRFHHSVEVAREAVRLAQRWGADPRKAQTAGILHDICKEFPRQAQLQWARKSGIILDDLTLQMPRLWHGPAAAGYIAQELSVDDRDILNAVAYHTSGRAEMSRLEKIIYLADLTSAERDYPDVDQMRQAVDRSLEEGMAYSLRYTVARLAQEGEIITPDTYRAYCCYRR